MYSICLESFLPTWGRWSHFDEHILNWVGSTANQKLIRQRKATTRLIASLPHFFTTPPKKKRPGKVEDGGVVVPIYQHFCPDVFLWTQSSTPEPPFRKPSPETNTARPWKSPSKILVNTFKMVDFPWRFVSLQESS